MTQLLDKLIVQAKSEAREALRKLILSLNGLAGLYILEKEVQCIYTWSCMYSTLAKTKSMYMGFCNAHYARTCSIYACAIYIINTRKLIFLHVHVRAHAHVSVLTRCIPCSGVKHVRCI